MIVGDDEDAGALLVRALPKQLHHLAAAHYLRGE